MRILAGLAILLVAGCTPSLEPLYTAQDTFFDPGFLGTWKEQADHAKDADWMVISRRDETAYRILHSEGGSSAVFTGRLVLIGRYRFVDLYPDRPDIGDGFYGGHLWRVHSFSRLTVETDRLTLHMLDPAWFETEAGRACGLERRTYGKEILLTAPTVWMRQFAERYAEDGPFSVTTTWVREATADR